jgi:radical SAM superfamily enzyme YgiQ (UPF0313 family)
MINASFVFGFDHDDPGVFERTVEFAKKVKLTSINFHILTPYPGTPFFKRLEEEGRILTRDWARFDTAHAVFQPSLMSPEELEAGYLWVYGEFYTWRSILHRMPSALTDRPRFLAFNIGLKKMNPSWEILIRLNLLSTAFRTYDRVDGVLWKTGNRTVKSRRSHPARRASRSCWGLGVGDNS